jgi:hypothetical protein
VDQKRVVLFSFNLSTFVSKPIPVAERSKARVYAFQELRGIGHGCLSLVSVVYCQVEVSTTDRSLV